MWVKLIVCIVAGMGAGLGTGFAGLSAAAVIAPMLIAFLNVPAYEAIGIALASDVLASATSAITYGKNKNIDIKNGLVMLITVLSFTIIGSYLASFMPDMAMGNMSSVTTLFMGIMFLFRPVKREHGKMQDLSKKQQVIRSVLCGIYIGTVCGFIGAGGGMMMLMVLTLILGYELKTAVGTSVFVMAFTALIGAVTHFVLGGLPDLLCLITCILATLLFAQIAASVANRLTTKALNLITGIVLTVLGLAILIVHYWSSICLLWTMLSLTWK